MRDPPANQAGPTCQPAGNNRPTRRDQPAINTAITTFINNIDTTIVAAIRIVIPTTIIRITSFLPH